MRASILLRKMNEEDEQKGIWIQRTQHLANFRFCSFFGVPRSWKQKRSHTFFQSNKFKIGKRKLNVNWIKWAAIHTEKSNHLRKRKKKTCESDDCVVYFVSNGAVDISKYICVVNFLWYFPFVLSCFHWFPFVFHCQRRLLLLIKYFSFPKRFFSRILAISCWFGVWYYSDICVYWWIWSFVTQTEFSCSFSISISYDFQFFLIFCCCCVVIGFKLRAERYLFVDIVRGTTTKTTFGHIENVHLFNVADNLLPTIQFPRSNIDASRVNQTHRVRRWDVYKQHDSNNNNNEKQSISSFISCKINSYGHI